MRGRKPVPTSLKVLRGNPGKRRLNDAEPMPEAMAIDGAPPVCLSEDGKVEWRRLAPMLGRLGVLTETDVDALVAYCEAWANWKQAQQKIRQFGMVIKSKDPKQLPVISPYVRIAHNAMNQMRAFLVEFGMTPSSRSRIKVTRRDQSTDKRRRFFGVGA